MNKSRQESRDRWAMNIARQQSLKSKDPSRKTGAVIVEKFSYAILGVGYNSLPKGIEDTPERRQRPKKYLFTEHAERNAMFDCLKEGYSTIGAIIYQLWYPCASCARAIVQSGISELVCQEPDWENIHNSDKWSEEFEAAKAILTESNVKVRFYDEL